MNYWHSLWPKRKRTVSILAAIALLGAVGSSLLWYASWPQDSVLGVKSERDNRQAITNPVEASQISIQSTTYLVDQAVKTKKFDPDEILLDIPLIEQKYKLSCEAASIQMALQYRGLQKTQEDLMEDIGYALPLEPQQTKDMVIWGDPDTGFVGSYKGRYMVAKEDRLEGDGWGTHEGPVLNAVQKYRSGSWAKKMATVDDLKTALEQDMPVIFWHVRDNHDKEKLEYFAPNGQRVVFEQFHVKLLIGYQNQNGQETWIFNDPIYGQLKLSTEDMLRQWTAYDSRMVAVG
jgi:uncharacterized protein YvpB